jgi:tRNA(Ile)-lysidine synthase
MPNIFGDAAIERAFACLEPFPSAALAVSGGPDSMALMHLARRWSVLKRRDLASLAVVTVDHGLRAESAREAAFVAEQTRGLGLRHDTLKWVGAKPDAGIQAAARRARYDLLAEHCASRSIGCVATAHTADDQAETFLMRLRRGSGVDGLAAMTAVCERGGVMLLRPLLGFSKTRLTAYLRSASVPFIEDPSNENAAFERVRLRRSMKALASAGIARSSLTMAASRLARSRDALDRIAKDVLAHHFCVSRLARGDIQADAFHALPEDIALRVLARALALIGGDREAPRLMKVEGLLSSLRGGKREATLGGCLIHAATERLIFYREPGRLKPEPMPFQPGASRLWDARFALTFSQEGDRETVVRQLGAEGWIAYKRSLAREGGRPAEERLAALTTPALWRGNRLVSAPAIGFDASPGGGAEKPITVKLAPILAAFLTPASTEAASMLGKGLPIPYL